MSALADDLGAGLQLAEDLPGALVSRGYNSGRRPIKSLAEILEGLCHAASQVIANDVRLFVRLHQVTLGLVDAALIAIPQRQRKRDAKADCVREIGGLMLVLEEDCWVRHAQRALQSLMSIAL